MPDSSEQLQRIYLEGFELQTFERYPMCMGVLRDGRKGPKAVRKKAVKCAFPAGEFFTASAEIFVALDDQERSSE